VRESRPPGSVRGVRSNAHPYRDGSPWLPSVRVMRLPHADHEIFTSNTADVIREMNDFIAKLPL
jgi:hypothetical protein